MAMTFSNPETKMAYYEISNTLVPPSTRGQDDEAFLNTLAALEVGQGFTFPVNSALKHPLKTFQLKGTKAAAKGTRFRWWLGDPGNGCVKRVK